MIRGPGQLTDLRPSERMALWYDSPVGQPLVPRMQTLLARLCRDAFGYHALQLGAAGGVVDLGEQLRIRHRILAHPGDGKVDCRVVFDELPFETESLDLVIGWHVLEDRRQPHEMLREMDRILRPEGRLILIGVNPVSLLHLSRYLPFVGRCHDALHGGVHHAPWRLVDWLRILGYEVNAIERVGGLWPRCRTWRVGEGALRRLDEGAWFLQGLYVISATRRVIKPIQSKPAFELKSWIGAGVAKPVGQRGVADPSGCTRHPRFAQHQRDE